MKLMIMSKTTSRSCSGQRGAIRKPAPDKSQVCVIGANVFRYPNFPPSFGNSCPDMTPRLVPLLGIGRAAGRDRLSPTAGAVHGQTLSDRRVSSGRPGRVAGPTDVVSSMPRRCAAPRNGASRMALTIRMWIRDHRERSDLVIRAVSRRPEQPHCECLIPIQSRGLARSAICASGSGFRWRSVKPSASPTLVRTQHLPHSRSTGVTRPFARTADPAGVPIDGCSTAKCCASAVASDAAALASTQPARAGV
jgi:hypothetical protein